MEDRGHEVQAVKQGAMRRNATAKERASALEHQPRRSAWGALPASASWTSPQRRGLLGAAGGTGRRPGLDRRRAWRRQPPPPRERGADGLGGQRAPPRSSERAAGWEGSGLLPGAAGGVGWCGGLEAAAPPMAKTDEEVDDHGWHHRTVEEQRG
jgi:hypothetical protein